MTKFTAKDDGTNNGTSHTLRSGMKGNFHVPFWREVEEGNFFYSPNPSTEQENLLRRTMGCVRFVYSAIRSS
ncbi:helix-turn-helix domain-containing protein [Hyella patelloides]|uniref:helix-turn-helix domain-containing protein n=1 Tax=Hyella patelloides TaxID=1982969 RepID=UPI00119E2D75|nr:helix-turn-helix domain-containing protein [Hyella patelloides]